MVLRGEIERPKNFVVITADPGMENSGTYAYLERMEREMDAAGLEHYVASGPDLYKGLLEAGLDGDATRFDLPPYWTKDRVTGKRGRMLQGCTKAFKIAPMDRLLRRLMEEKLGVSAKSKRPGVNVVEKWIGFSYDEVHRVKPSETKYCYFAYPLIERRMSNADVLKYFADRALPAPPRSVCNACFANSVAQYKEMYENRPDDWRQAVNVDRAIRTLSHLGVKHELFVSHTLVPLEELAARQFVLGDTKNLEDEACTSGYCFT